MSLAKMLEPPEIIEVPSNTPSPTIQPHRDLTPPPPSELTPPPPESDKSRSQSRSLKSESRSHSHAAEENEQVELQLGVGGKNDVEKLEEPSVVPPLDAASTNTAVLVSTVADLSSAPTLAPPTPSQKPKSKLKADRSPSPAPPAPPPPRQTIRLEIPLGGPDNYEVDIHQLSKDTGQVPPDPPSLQPVSDGESDGEDDKDAKEDKDKDKDEKSTKRGRKTTAQEYYDLHDPFIDDSELAVDERTHMAQTKQKGFYVVSGEVQLLKDNNPSPSKLKPKSKRERERDKSPIEASAAEDGDAKTGGKRKGADELWMDHARRKKSRTMGDKYSPEMEVMIDDMKKKIATEDWSAKGKFPPDIKPALRKLAVQAIKSDEYDDAFFSLMPKLFPYNKFTMTKLIKRLVYQDHYDYLMKKQDDRLVELKQIADEGFERAKEEWERSVLLWEKRVQKAKDAAGEGATPGDPGAGGEDVEMPPATMPPSTQNGVKDDDGADGDAPTLNSKDAHPPPKKYRMTERIRQLLWELVQLSNEGVKITNEKNTLENNTEPPTSEQGVRKGLYQKIVACFPEGWMNSGNLSREVSAIKKKLEKEDD